MPDFDLDFKVEGALKLAALARELRQAGRRDLRRGLDSAIRREARPIVRAVKRSAMQIPARGGAYRRGERSLRSRISGAVGVQIVGNGPEVGVAILVRSERLGNKHMMPGLLNRSRGWRHPVFGRKNWVEQKGYPWFHPPILRHEVELARAIDREMDRVANQIERSVG